MLRLGVITDEIDADLDRALAVAAELGLREIELNGVWGRNLVELSGTKLDRVEKLVTAGGFRVCAVATPALKALPVEELVPGDGAAPSAEAEKHLDWIRRGCRIAERLN